MEFSENTRVKIPAIVHTTRLGYKYLSLKDFKNDIDENTNIFKSIFKSSINKINDKEFDTETIDKLINELSIALSNEDLGKSFYKYLINGYKGIKLIDFNNENNNTFNVVTELTYKNGEDEFRPDIIILINGMPLGFIEVKKPNNRDGILTERDRINRRFKNKKFLKFVNLTQLLVFSNNQEYNEDSVVPIEGAFYGTPNYGDVFFNCFREEDSTLFSKIDNFKLEYDNFKRSLNKINDYFYNINEDNNIKDIKVDTTAIDNKNKYVDNYIYNAVVNYANYNYKKESKNISKIKENDIIQEIILKHYLNNKKQTRKDILKNYLSNPSPKQKFKNKQEIENAIRNINDEMEEAQKEFSKLFNTTVYEK